MAIGPHNDGGREFPLSVLCRLENHKSQGYNSVRVQHPGGAGGGIISKSLKARESGTLMSEGRKTWTSQLEKRERESSLPPPFSSWTYWLIGLIGLLAK